MLSKVIVLCSILSIALCGIAKVKHPYLRMKIIKSHACEDVENEIEMNLEIKRLTEDVNSYSMNLTMPYDFGDDIMAHIRVDKWRGDYWEKDAITMKQDHLCTFAHSYLGETVYMLQDRVNMPRGQCPWPKGFYEDKDLVLNLDLLGIPAREYPSIMRVNTRLYKDDRLIMCRVSTLELF